MSSLPNTVFTCQNLAQQSSINQGEYYGNRGINLIKDYIFTPLNNLVTAQPSLNAIKSVINKAAYNTNETSDLTIWLEGYLNPKTSSIYKFNLSTNGVAQLYISNDTNSLNKVLISSTNQMNGTVQLEANKNYYMKLIASIKNGTLNLALNGHMFQTYLTNQVSAYVFNEKQSIQINSIYIPESYVIKLIFIFILNIYIILKNVQIEYFIF